MKKQKEKFTPGPWSIGRSDCSGPGRISQGNEYSNDADVICHMPNPKTSYTEATFTESPKLQIDQKQISLNEANAHLIAAAPEMYDALEYMDKLWVKMGNKPLVVVSNALEKARGEK